MLRDEELKFIGSERLSDYLYDEDITEDQKRKIALELLDRTQDNEIWLRCDFMYELMDRISMEDLVTVSKSKNPLTAGIAYTVMSKRMVNTKNADYLSDIDARANTRVKIKSKGKKRY